jgi:hypothetical protein
MLSVLTGTKVIIMTTEFICSALSEDGEVFELLTCAACIIPQAIEQFKKYVYDNGGEWGHLVTLSLTAIEADD